MKSAFAALTSCFDQALLAALDIDGTEFAPLVVPSSNPKFGDFQSNVAMALAKRLKMNPQKIAEHIVDKLDVNEFCEAPQVVRPGFINLRLKKSYLERQLQSMSQSERLGVAIAENPQRVIVDYPSPNIAKEMHVGHLRPAVIGECFARVLEFLGHDVLKLNHVGDWGTPFGMLIAYLTEAYPDALKNPESLALTELSTFYRQAKKRFDADEGFQMSARDAVVQLQGGESETLKAWEIICDLSKRSYRKIYDLLDVSTDIVDRGESFYNPFLADVVIDLKEQGLLVEDAGAQCVFLEGFTNKDGNPLPLIIQKSDGGFNYATTDLAGIRYRVNEDGAQRIVYTTDSGQTNHFAQVFQVSRRAGWANKDIDLVFAPFGLVLAGSGKKFKTRSGDTVPLEDLLNEAIVRARADLESRIQEEGRDEPEDFIKQVAEIVGISSVKYADLSQNRTSNYIFSYDKMLSLKGNTAPYMLYAYVRIRSISRKGEIDFENLAADKDILLDTDAELNLAKHLLQLDEVLDEVATTLLPNRLCQYLFELAQKFNQFYDSCPVLQAEEPSRTSRLMLCDLTARSLKLGLWLLGIRVLERM